MEYSRTLRMTSGCTTEPVVPARLALSKRSYVSWRVSTGSRTAGVAPVLSLHANCH